MVPSGRLRALAFAGVGLAGGISLALAAQAAPDDLTAVLYDGSLGTGTPDTQGFQYLAIPKPGEEPLAARQTFADGVTTLTTTLKTTDSAGYFARPDRLPGPLMRDFGFTLSFTVQVTAEEHAASDKNADGIGDRAGFSVIAISQDLKGIELGFWADQVWAQEDGAAEPPPNTNTLFTHAEGAPFDTTTGLTPYDLRIEGDTYTLSSRGERILTGRLRDYSVFGWPYNVPSFMFLGDDTTSASGTIRFARAAIRVHGDFGTETPTPEATDGATATPTVDGTATPTATPTPSATPTATPTPCRLFPTPEWLRVDPVKSPTFSRRQTIRVGLNNGDWVEVESPLGTWRQPGQSADIEVLLAPNQVNALTVRGHVRRMESGGCVFGDYTLTTRQDHRGAPLDIEQRSVAFLPVARKGP